MKRRLVRTVPANTFYASIVSEALAIATAFSTSGIDAAMRGAAFRQQRGTRRERLGALRERLAARNVARSAG